MQFSLLFVDLPSVVTNMFCSPTRDNVTSWPRFLETPFQIFYPVLFLHRSQGLFPSTPSCIKIHSWWFHFHRSFHDGQFTSGVYPANDSLVLLCYTLLQDYSYKSATFINSLHILSTCKWHLRLSTAQTPDCKAYPSHGPNPKLFPQQAGYSLSFKFIIQNPLGCIQLN